MTIHKNTPAFHERAAHITVIAMPICKGIERLYRLSKKWLAPLFRGFHSSLAPTARPGSYAGKPLLRKAFCGFAVHAAKSD